MSPPAIRVLQCLPKLPCGARVSELSEDCGMTRPKVHQAVEALRDMGIKICMWKQEHCLLVGISSEGWTAAQRLARAHEVAA